MPHYSVFTLKDYSDEETPVTIYNGAITAGTLPGFLTEFGQMRDAIDAITLGTVKKEKWVGDDTLISDARPASPIAQRESKWLVFYRDVVTNKVHRLEIGTADVGAVGASRLVPGTDLADLTNTEIAAFVTRFESFARSEAGNMTDVVKIQKVGRNI